MVYLTMLFIISLDVEQLFKITVELVFQKKRGLTKFGGLKQARRIKSEVKELLGFWKKKKYYKEENDALLSAVADGYIDVELLLLKNGGDVNARDKYDRTILMLVALQDDNDTVKILLDKGADIDAKTIKGKTALMYVAKEGHRKTAKTLLDNNANMNIKNKKDWTALMYAEENGHIKVAELLIQSGAKETKYSNPE